ncbi:8184_t:CDS:2 [Acaulospora morrowiae]|uniref:8184_t:CDS:1 n=1 Tax=Acaulospora morrowiae TaxID=94023 RepID=A0A9N8VQY4_9GLOM|nr:8184_t:CDS:2 [Acaulospora morrowiae]
MTPILLFLEKYDNLSNTATSSQNIAVNFQDTLRLKIRVLIKKLKIYRNYCWNIGNFCQMRRI